MKEIFEQIIRALDRLLTATVVLLCGIVLFVSGYSLLDNMRLYQDSVDDSLLTYKPVLNQEIEEEDAWITLDGQAAWLSIDSTYIDYPVMQGKDNFEYLNKDPYGNFKISGSIFLDCRNSKDFSDDYSMIYGHHMDRYAMFGSLDLFTIEAYFQGHHTGWFATQNGVYQLELFAVAWGSATDQTIFNPSNRSVEDIIAYIDNNAVINTGYEPGHRIIALSTCAGETELSRLIVFGMLKEQK